MKDSEARKEYYLRMDVGRRGNYVVNYHDGVSTHRDRSPFYAIQIFRNRKKAEAFMKKLERDGYKER